ncbi:glycosyl hydrolase family 28 protein [Isoptericola sp. F-RaC21]|uniref:glycoside hydrolase family 28 protein n=1 Tax=Isoptericola sp. F-RaC21 TaxID=3141452 RepID=UPI00315BE1CE
MKDARIRRRPWGALVVAPLLAGTMAGAILAPAAAAAQKDEPQATSPVNVDRAPDGAQVLAQSVGEVSGGAGHRLHATLVWGRPAGADRFVDYAVYSADRSADGGTFSRARLVGRAGQDAHLPAQRAFDVFYADPDNADAVRVAPQNIVLDDLSRDREYRFEVRGVTADGTQVPLDSAYTTSVVTPAKPAKQFVVTEHGYGGVPAVRSAADGGALVQTAALQRAIDDAAAFAVAVPDRSAEVVVPAGDELRSTALHLASGVTLRVDGTLKASLDLDGYVPEGTKFTAVNAEKYLNLINVDGTKDERLQNVRIVGTGVIDGQGWKYRTDGEAPDVEYADQLGLEQSRESTWRTVAENGLLAGEVYRSCVAAGGPEGDDACYKKRANLVEGEYVDHLYIGDGLRLQNSSNTVTGFKYLTDYVVNGVTIQSFNSNNGDSVNVARFKGFTALNNVINSGDDNLVMNAGNSSEYDKNGDAAVAGSAWVFDNYMARGHGGVAFGSGTASWIDNVLVENNVFVGTSDGIRAKSKPGSGGGVRFVTVRNIAMKNLTNLVGGKVDPLTVGYQMDGAPFIFTTHYPGDYQATRWPSFHDWDVSHVTVDGSRTAGIVVDGIHDDAKMAAAGLEFIPSNNLHFRDVHFRGAGVPLVDGLRDSTFDDVTFADADGASVAHPWTNAEDVAGVTADGVPVAGADQTFAVTSGDGAVVGADDELRVVTEGSFTRLYTNTLPEDVYTRTGTVSIDGVPVADDLYPRFAPKTDDLALVEGSDAALGLAPRSHTNIGSVITLRRPLLDGLAPGEHTLRVDYTNGAASATFTVAGGEEN